MRLLRPRMEAARLLVIGQRTLDNPIRGGELRCKRVERHVLVEAQALRQFAASGCPRTRASWLTAFA